jgi:hypothetical protein
MAELRRILEENGCSCRQMNRTLRPRRVLKEQEKTESHQHSLSVIRVDLTCPQKAIVDCQPTRRSKSSWESVWFHANVGRPRLVRRVGRLQTSPRASGEISEPLPGTLGGCRTFSKPETTDTMLIDNLDRATAHNRLPSLLASGQNMATACTSEKWATPPKTTGCEYSRWGLTQPPPWIHKLCNHKKISYKFVAYFTSQSVTVHCLSYICWWKYVNSTTNALKKGAEATSEMSCIWNGLELRTTYDVKKYYHIND